MYYGWTVARVTLIWIFVSKSFARECIRNEEKVAKGRVCNPVCKINSDCVNPGEKCICDDVCGRSCFNPDLLCRKLESPRYGYILGKERHYDDSVLYYCHSGYVLNGPNHRRCRSDGNWTGITPKCLPVSTCGLSETPGERLTLKKVVRGSQTSISRWPWHVTLIQNLKNKIDDSFESLHGSGTIINDQWVLTAAHLFALFSTNKPALVDHSIFIVAGISEIPKVGSMLHDGVQVYRPGVIIRHPRFNRINNDNDICLIRVGARVVPGKKGRFEISPSLPSFRFTFDEYVRPVCLPCVNEWVANSLNISVKSKYSRDKCETRQDMIVGQPAVVTGFGGTAPINQNALFSVKWSNVLRKGDLIILPDSVCIKGVKKINVEFKDPEFTSNMICAKGVDANHLQDACRGDSGGPLVTKVLSNEGREYWVLAGIVSWGWGCANQDKEGFTFPGYYSNVTKFVPWIFENMEKTNTREDTQNSIVTAYLVIYAFSANRVQRTYWKLVVDINSTIDSVKQDIENNFPNYKKYQQQLYFAGKRMFTDRTLRSYGIRNPKPIIPVRVFLN